MLKQEKPRPSPFGGEVKTEEFKVKGLKPEPPKAKKKAKIQEMITESIEKKRNLRPRGICGC